MKFERLMLGATLLLLGCGKPELEVTLSHNLSSSTATNPEDLELLITNVGKEPVTIQDLIVNEQYRPFFECRWSYTVGLTTKMNLDSNSLEEISNAQNWTIEIYHPEFKEYEKRDSLSHDFMMLRDQMGWYRTLEIEKSKNMDMVLGSNRQSPQTQAMLWMMAGVTQRIKELWEDYSDTTTTIHYGLPVYTNNSAVVDFKKKARGLLVCDETPSIIRLGETQAFKVSNFYINVDSVMTRIKGQPMTFKIRTDRGTLEGTFENLNATK